MAAGQLGGTQVTGQVKGLGGSTYIPDIGYVWKSADSTCPAALYAGTTWVQIKDQAILASGDTYAIDDSGGNATVTLTTGEMPVHTHTGSTSNSGEHSHNSITTYGQRRSTSSDSRTVWYGDHTGITSTNGSTSTNGTHSHALNVGSSGAGKSFGVMMPYIVRYVWERIG